MLARFDLYIGRRTLDPEPVGHPAAPSSQECLAANIYSDIERVRLSGTFLYVHVRIEMDERQGDDAAAFLKHTICQVCTTVPAECGLTTPFLPFDNGIGTGIGTATGTATSGTTTSGGSGFFIDAQALGVENAVGLAVVTTFQVIRGAVSISVHFHHDPSAEPLPLPMRLLTANPQYDLAILVPQAADADFPTDCRPLALGSSTSVRADTELYFIDVAIDSVIDSAQHVKVQHCKRTGFSVGTEDIFLQYNARALNTDSSGAGARSGGPLLVLDDDPAIRFRVVGIHATSATGMQANHCVAILVERLRWMLNVYCETGKQLQDRFDLGIDFQDGEADLVKHLLEIREEDWNGTGVMVSTVSGSSSGACAFKRFDFIVGVSGLEVNRQGEVKDPTLGPAAPSIPLQIYASRQPYGDFLEVDVFRHLSKDERITVYEARRYEKRIVEVHLVTDASATTGLPELYVPYDRPDFEILGGMVLVDLSKTILMKFGRGANGRGANGRAKRWQTGVMIVNVLPQGEVLHNESYSKLAEPGTLLTHLNGVRIHSIAHMRKLLTTCWHPDEHAVIFETENQKFVVLTLTQLHEDNACVAEIYDARAASASIPHSLESAGAVAEAAVHPTTVTQTGEEPELASFHQTLYESLGLNWEDWVVQYIGKNNKSI